MTERKLHYMHISHSLRKELIRLVEEEKMKVAVAAKQLGIKDSTARAIYTKFQKDNTIFESRKEANERIVIEEYERKVMKKE